MEILIENELKSNTWKGNKKKKKRVEGVEKEQKKEQIKATSLSAGNKKKNPLMEEEDGSKEEVHIEAEEDEACSSEVLEVPKVNLSCSMLFEKCDELCRKDVAVTLAMQLVADVVTKSLEDSEQEAREKEVAVDRAKRLISKMSRMKIDQEEELEEEVEPTGIQEMESAGDKAKQLLSAVSKRDQTADESDSDEGRDLSPSSSPEHTDWDECEMNSLKVDGGVVYDIEDVVNAAGYGKFQRVLLLLCGITWMISSYAISLNTILGDMLACEWTIYRWQNALLTAIVSVGANMGALNSGIIADNFGRKTVLSISILATAVVVACTVFANNLSTVLVFRCLFGFFVVGFLHTFSLGWEYYPVKERGTVSLYMTFYWSCGQMLLVVTASVVYAIFDNWRWLVFVTSLPIFMLFFVVEWFPESARFFLVSHQYDRAVKQLEQMLDMNKVRLPRGRLKEDEDDMRDRGNFLGLLQKKYLRATFLLWFLGFATFFGYYGTILITPFWIKFGKSIMANAKDTTDIFTSPTRCLRETQLISVDLFYSTASEIPGVFIFIVLLQFMRRQTLMCGGCVVSSLCISMYLLDISDQLFYLNWIIQRAIVCVNSVMPLIIVLEVYPTYLRAVGLGSVMAFSMLGGAVAPFFSQDLLFRYPRPVVIFVSSLLLLGAVASACLPRKIEHPWT